MYIIFNKDGSVSESQLTDYINQHSDGVNFIDISIVGKSVDEYTADGNFKLPNNEVVSLTGAFTNKIKTSTGVYEGYRITLSAVVTEYQGDVALSIQVFNSDKTTLFTYPVTLYVNETTGRGGDPITQDQYEALRAMMADYQLQYARSNMRSYDTLAEATEDLPNLSEGQMILAKETADSETSSVFQKVGDKLEGVSLDGLALDKFLRNKNAVGTGSFEWKVENQKYGYKNYFKIENGNQVTLGFDGSGMTPSFTIGSGIYSALINSQGVSIDGSPIYWSKNVINPSGKPYYLYSTLLGERNGVASLNEIGKIPTSQLPSYVSDVLEFASFDRFPSKGEANKIYIALDTNKTYRWGGTVYVEIGSSLALGETSETAYAGDKGKRNADNITALQSEKLNRKSGLSVTPETLVYACEAGGAESSYVDKYIQASLQNIGNAIPITAGNGAIYGRSSQASEDPEIANVLSYELITKAYADKEYKFKYYEDELSFWNDWNSKEHAVGEEVAVAWKGTSITDLRFAIGTIAKISSDKTKVYLIGYGERGVSTDVMSYDHYAYVRPTITFSSKNVSPKNVEISGTVLMDKSSNQYNGIFWPIAPSLVNFGGVASGFRRVDDSTNRYCVGTFKAGAMYQGNAQALTLIFDYDNKEVYYPTGGEVYYNDSGWQNAIKGSDLKRAIDSIAEAGTSVTIRRW